MGAGWYYSAGDKQMGPVEDTTIKNLAAVGQIKPDTLICHAEKTKNQWVAANRIPGLRKCMMERQPVDESLDAEPSPAKPLTIVPQATHTESASCPSCGHQVMGVEKLRGQAVVCPGCQKPFQIGGGYTSSIPVPSNQTIAPGLAAFLSFLLVGLGQMANGQVAKGIVIIPVVVILAFFTGCISIFFTHPAVIIDAYLIAQKRREGKPVGDWEFF